MQGNQIKLPTTDHYLGINDCFTIDWKWYIKKLCTEALQIGATLLLLFSKRNFRRTVDYMQYTDMLKVTKKKKLTQDQSRRAHQHDLKQPSLNENSSCWTKKKICFAVAALVFRNDTESRLQPDYPKSPNLIETKQKSWNLGHNLTISSVNCLNK